MCGLVGVLRPRAAGPVRTQDMAALLSWIRHRGPDEEATHVVGGFGLAASRLRVRGGDAGRQPMVADDGNVVLAFNGELLGAVPADQSDTAWLLARYLEGAGREGAGDPEDGPELLALEAALRGAMGVAVVLDRRLGWLRIVQGGPRIKPVHLGVDDDGALWFASEIAPLLAAVPAFRRTTDALLATTLHTHAALPGPYPDLLADPGAAAWMRAATPDGFAAPDAPALCVLASDEDVDASYHGDPAPPVRRALIESARAAAATDGPASLFLSGGLDSGAVALLAGRRDLLGLTGRFAPSDDAPNDALDESQAAAVVAAAARIPHETIDLADEDLVQDLPAVVAALELPTAGPGSLSLWRMAQRATAHGRVVLTGTGGDELLGGYTRIALLAGRAGAWTEGYEPLAARLAAAGTAPDARLAAIHDRLPAMQSLLHGDLARSLVPAASLPWSLRDGEGLMGAALRIERETTLPTLLHVEDRVLARHGLEGRPVPCLGALPSLARAFHPDQLVGPDGEGKRPLRAALEGLMPEAVRMDRRKRGFPTPFARAARGAGRPAIDALLSDQRFRERGWFDVAACRALLDAARPVHDRALWMVCVLETWARAFLDGDLFRETDAA